MGHRWVRRVAALERGVDWRRREELRRRGLSERAALLDRAAAIATALADPDVERHVRLMTADMDPPLALTPRQSALLAVALGRPDREWAQDVSTHERSVLRSLVAQWTVGPQRQKRRIGDAPDPEEEEERAHAG